MIRNILTFSGVVLAAATCIVFAGAVVGAVLLGWTATGPGCPGDPEWLGWCHKVETLK